MKLIRIADTAWGTFGVLISDGLPFCLTLERPWLDNIKNTSCIPPGRYVCKRVMSPKFGETFEVCDVPGRSHILFHKGNLMDDSHGCIILGERFDPLDGKPAVLSSGDAFKEFMQRTRGFDKFPLEIVKI